MNELDPLNVDFVLNSPAVKKEATVIKAELNGVAAAGEKASARTAAAQVGMLERLKTKVKELKKESLEATSIVKIEKANTQIQIFEKEITRLKNIGKQGWDDMGNRITSSFEKPIGQVNRLKYAVELYKKAAAEAVNPELITKYNKKLEGAQAEVKRLGNIGKIGFDGMGNSIVQAGEKVKGTTNLLGRAWSSLRMIANILPGIGIAGIFGLALAPLFEYIGKLTTAEKIQKAFNETAQETASLIAKEVVETTVLIEKIKDKNTAYSTRKTLLNDFINQSPQVLGELTLQNIANKEGTEIINKYLESLREKIRLQQLEKSYTESVQKETDLKSGKLSEETDVGSIKAAIFQASEILTFGSKENYKKRLAEMNTIRRDEAAKAQAIISKGYKDQLTAEIEGSKALRSATDSSLNALENQLKGTKERLENLQKGKSSAALIAEKRALEKQIEARKEELGLNDKKNTTSGESAAAKRKRLDDQSKKSAEDLSQKILDISAEYARKSKTQDEQEVQAVRDKFTRIAEEVKKFNADPENKLHKVDGSGLDKTRDQAIEDLEGKQAVERYKIQVEQQKQVFTQFEQYKLEFGAGKATERYGEELKGFKTYLQYLEALSELHIENSSAEASAMKDFLAQEIPKAKREASDKEFDTNVRNLKRITDMIRTAASETNRINEQYDKDLNTLRSNYKGEELAEKEATLARFHREELKGVRDMAFEETKIAQDMAANLFYMTRQQLKDQIKLLKGDLKTNDELADGNPSKLTPAQRQQLKASIDQAKEVYKSTDETATLSQKIADYAGAASQAFNEMASALDGVNDDLAQTLGTVGSLLGAVSNISSAIASKDPLKIATSLISGVASLFTISKRVKEMNAAARAEVQKYYELAATGEAAYQAMLRERERQQAAMASKNIAGLTAEQELLKKQSDSLNKEYLEIFAKIQGEQYVDSTSSKHGTWFRKAKVTQDLQSLSGKGYDELERLYSQGKLTDGAKALFEQLQKLKNEGADVAQTLADLAVKAQELFTGTTSDALTDSLLEMFKTGRTGVQDLADFFQSTMQQAALSIFKNDVLSGVMTRFYKDFAADAQSNGGLDQTEIDRLRALFLSLSADAQKQFDDLKKVTGLDLNGSSSSNSLQGSIKASLSEETGSVLAGTLNGVRLAQLETNSIGRANGQTMQQQLTLMKSSVEALYKIADNTKRSADVLEGYLHYLKSIDTGVRDNTGLSLRAAGKFGY